MNIKISSKWIRHKFLCSKEYITNVCNGRCCKEVISLLPDELEYFKSKGYKPGDSCPFLNKNGLCKLHGTKNKPVGCIVSPFFIKKGTLLIRHRYNMMDCHNKTGDYAYKVFRPSLDLIFGLKESERVCKLLDAGLSNIYAEVSNDVYDKLEYLESLKIKGRTHNFVKNKRLRSAISVDKWLK